MNTCELSSDRNTFLITYYLTSYFERSLYAKCYYVKWDRVLNVESWSTILLLFVLNIEREREIFQNVYNLKNFKKKKIFVSILSLYLFFLQTHRFLKKKTLMRTEIPRKSFTPFQSACIRQININIENKWCFFFVISFLSIYFHTLLCILLSILIFLFMIFESLCEKKNNTKRNLWKKKKKEGKNL